MRWSLPCLALVACGGDEDARTQFDIRMENVSAAGALSTGGGATFDVKFAPGVLVFHQPGFEVFTLGAALPSTALESLVEEGDNAPIIAALGDDPDVVFVDAFAALDETYNAAPMGPGAYALLSAEAEDGLSLTLLAMYGESNDLFVATPPGGLPLFDAGAPLEGDLSAELALYDAGTEVNEEPGVGPNQPARQAAPGDGDVEGGVVAVVGATDVAGFSYPAVVDMLEVTVSATEVAAE